MLQISLGSLVWAIVYRWYSFTGGDDGIHGIPKPELIDGSTGTYYFVLIVTLACLGVMYLMVNSPFGRVFMAIRDNPGPGPGDRRERDAPPVEGPGPGRVLRRRGGHPVCHGGRQRVSGPHVLDPIHGK